MTHEEIINMIETISSYLERRDESPLAARDLRRLIPELKRLWKLEEECANEKKMRDLELRK